jgi:hypothetical protein
MMIKPGPKTYCAALNSEDAAQWKEAIRKEVSSMEIHGLFTFVERPAGDASMIESRWVMGRKHLPNGETEKWQVRLVGYGDQQKPGEHIDITSAGSDSAPVGLAHGLAAKHDLDIEVLDILTTFLGYPVLRTLSMCLLDGEWPYPYCQACPTVRLNKRLYGIKQENREYLEEVFACIVTDLGLQVSVAACGLFFGGTLSKPNGILMPIYVEDIKSIGSLKLIYSITS